MELILAVIIALALATALVLRRAGRRSQEDAGVPVNAQVIASDTGSWRSLEEPLFARRFRLTGKPDYIVEDERGAVIPIEVKPNRRAPEPHPWDIMQLMAYGLLLEEEFGKRPGYGLLKYRDTLFRVEFTDDLRAGLIELFTEMREARRAGDVPRSHEDSRRCASCGYRDECSDRLSS